MRFFIANWKANKTLAEAHLWVDEFTSYTKKNPLTDTVIICPPDPFLIPLLDKVSETSHLEIGTQNISQYPGGSYTGETTGKHLKGIVKYAIIGHHERRAYFNENDDVLLEKFIQAKTAGIEPIYCIGSTTDKIPDQAKIIAYEPSSAIGTGQNEDPKRVVEIKKELNLSKNTFFLYGGSVTSQNATSYLKTGEIDGFLIGSESLDPLNFYRIVTS